MSAFAVGEPASCKRASRPNEEKTTRKETEDEKPNYDYLNFSDWDTKKEDKHSSSMAEYILGTLILRVVAARNLQVSEYKKEHIFVMLK